MKTRTGFVSNSSSSSFMLVVPNSCMKSVETLHEKIFGTKEDNVIIEKSWSNQTFLQSRNIAKFLFDALKNGKLRKRNRKNKILSFLREIEEIHEFDLFYDKNGHYGKSDDASKHVLSLKDKIEEKILKEYEDNIEQKLSDCSVSLIELGDDMGEEASYCEYMWQKVFKIFKCYYINNH